MVSDPSSGDDVVIRNANECCVPLNRYGRDVTDHPADQPSIFIIEEHLTNHEGPSSPPAKTESDWFTVHFTCATALVQTLSIGSLLFDVGSDVWLAHRLREEKIEWAAITLGFVVIPLVVVNCFSFYWFWHDDVTCKCERQHGKRPAVTGTTWIIRILVHILLLGTVYRAISLMYYGWKVKTIKKQKKRYRLAAGNLTTTNQPNNYHLHGHRFASGDVRMKDYSILYLCEDRDVSMLHLIESFMQDAPQLVLQIYIMGAREEWEKILSRTVNVQIFSIVTSLVSLSLSLVSYNRALRHTVSGKHSATYGALLTQFLWRVGTIGSRVVALSLFAVDHQYIMIGQVVAHFVLMTLWVTCQHTVFCQETDDSRKRRNTCGEIVFDVVVGILYVFCFLNVKDEPTRLKLFFYYSFMFIQNGADIVLWYVSCDEYPWYHHLALGSVFASFVLGICFMCLYYRHFHPDKDTVFKQPAVFI